MKRLITISLLMFVLISCEKKNADKIIAVPPPASAMNLEFNQDSTTINWVAYKYTRKVGVKGVFDTFKISDVKKGSTASEMFTGATFSITMNSINSGVPARDAKLVKYFFEILKSSEMLTGKLISLDEHGHGKMSYTMNNLTSEIDVISSLDGKIFTLSGTLDLAKHNAQPAIKALNDACGQNHIGNDGKSVMWPDVDFKIVTKL